MTVLSTELANPHASEETFLQTQIGATIDALINSLPDVAHLTAEERRGIVARYTAVLEGNFVYWMTGAYLSARSEEARSVILENLHEEVRDSHPAMLRRFALAAHAIPTASDVMAVHEPLTDVRLFVGRLAPVRVIVTMAFFEGFIQKFMDFLGRLAAAQGSLEQEYTDVHGVCDVAHSRELFRAVAEEMALAPSEPAANLLEGVDLLSVLIETIVFGAAIQKPITLSAAG